MTGSSRKPTVHLSLVTNKGGAGKFVSLESLPPMDIERTRIYHRAVSPQGVLIGVIRGALEWDIRPLILQDGIVTVTRFFSKELVQSDYLSDSFKSYIFNVESASPGKLKLQCGSGEGFIWATRKYFGNVLSDGQLDISTPDRIALVADLMKEIQELHSKGLVHGHIVPSNIAFDEGKLVLIDHGFQLFDPGSARSLTLAPELRQSVASQLKASPASDLYGLGLVLKSIFGTNLSSEIGNLIEVLLLSDPSLRPSFNQVLKLFPAKEEVNTPIALPVQVKESKPLPQWVWILPSILIGCTVLLYVLSFIPSLFTHRETEIEVSDELHDYWKSGQVQLMQKVVAAALDGDFAARQLILDSAIDGEPNPLVKNVLFKRAFFPLWEKELVEYDIQTIYALGLTSLVPEKYRKVGDLSRLHPGALIALISSLSIGELPDGLSKIPLSYFTKLAPPFGSALRNIEKLDYKDTSSSTVQALIHLLFGEVDNNIAKAFIGNEVETAKALAKLEIVLPLLELLPGLDESLYNTMSTLQTDDLFFSWYERDILAQWKATPALAKLKSFAGVFPSEELSFEQLVDLLRFPRASLRTEAKERLLKGIVPPQFSEVLNFLAAPNSNLTRAQTISLLAALSVKGNRDLEFINQWFETVPDSDAVVQIILARGPAGEGVDIFNIQAARFLLKHPTDVAFTDLQKLTFHSEPLVRAFAYSKLRLDVPEEKVLLRSALQRETNSKLKANLIARLK